MPDSLVPLVAPDTLPVRHDLLTSNPVYKPFR